MPTRSTARSGAAPRAPRSDALRNRTALLSTARRMLAARGLDVPVEEIAREAGVGVGTVYRNFPTKAALLAAVIAQAFDELTVDARAALARPSVGDAFFEYLRSLAAVMARDRVLVAAARAVDRRSSTRGPEVQALFDAVDELLERAIDAGAVRPGITAEDIAALLAGVGEAGDERGRRSPAALDRYVAVLVDGLRPQAGSPAGGPIEAPGVRRSRR
jgi:AcrR family transcriptional regulator